MVGNTARTASKRPSVVKRAVRDSSPPTMRLPPSRRMSSARHLLGSTSASRPKAWKNSLPRE